MYFLYTVPDDYKLYNIYLIHITYIIMGWLANRQVRHMHAIASDTNWIFSLIVYYYFIEKHLNYHQIQNKKNWLSGICRCRWREAQKTAVRPSVAATKAATKTTTKNCWCYLNLVCMNCDVYFEYCVELTNIYVYSYIVYVCRGAYGFWK